MEGYITVITDGNARYVEMAINLALSIKLNDKRPVCLLTDEKTKIPKEYRKYFDYKIIINSSDALAGTLNKFLLFKYSPFEKSLYIDPDSLLIKNDVSYFWKKLNNYHFTVVGWECYNQAKFGGRTVSEIRAITVVPYVVVFTGSLIYFNKSETSKKVFEKAYEYYKERKDILSRARAHGGLVESERNILQYDDQPFFGIAMGFFNLEPFPPRLPDKSLKSLLLRILKGYPRAKEFMLSTKHPRQAEQYNEYNINIAKKNCVLIDKNNRRKSPTILHFYGNLHPREMYVRESNELRRIFKLPPVNL